MSQLDDFVSKLSDDELDTLNSSPELQAQLKAKYAPPMPNPNATEAMREGVTEGIKTALPSPSFAQPLAPTSPNPVIGGAQAALQTLRDPTRISPTVCEPAKIVGQAVEKFGTENMQDPLVGKVGGFLTRTTLDPNTWTMMGDSLLPDEVKEGLPSFLRKSASIPEKATQMEGYNQPAPTEDEIQQGIANIQNAVKKVWKDHGQVLNEAKSDLGIPTTIKEKEQSLQMYGNTYGLGPDVINSVHAKMLNHSNPEELASNIAKFKAMVTSPAQNEADSSLIARVATALQDKINKVVDWHKTGSDVEGVLKNQYDDLSNIITEASPKLTATKAKMGDLFNIMDDISKKLSGSPGEAEAYLRKLFTSKSPTVKDDLNALAKIDKLAGTNSVEQLFQKFAGESYNQTLGQSVHTIFQAPYAMLTSPRFVIKPTLKYGPYAAKAARFGTIGAGFPLSQENISQLQSAGDRIPKNESTD